MIDHFLNVKKKSLGFSTIIAKISWNGGKQMIITEFDRDDLDLRDQLADLLRLTWPEEYGTDATKEVDQLMEPDRIAVSALDGDTLIGFVGAIPQYRLTGWELHPLVVESTRRRNQIGTRLVTYLEKEVTSKGGITMYLGTDDLDHGTTLSYENLFEHTFDKAKAIQNLKSHPYEFYEKMGYQIVGVIPDANGWNKPDIWMAKGLVPRPTT
ncbi:aminoglycoside N(6)-acetyltransferase [Enterococcus thailandicus]|nr:aminoglycoside N(6)-acetyltransferase [Enterococcus thailandicus]